MAQLWPLLFDRYGLEIAFAHRTFEWGSDARGKAHVHVVIIGLDHRDDVPVQRRLFSYPDIKADPVETQHRALSPYLFDASGLKDPHTVVKEESKPINGLSKIVIGSKPIDGGHFIFSRDEMRAFLAAEPLAERFFHPFIGSREFLHGGERFILYVGDAAPNELRDLRKVRAVIANVRAYRLGEIPAKGKEDESKKIIEELRKQLKTLQTEYDTLLLVKKKYDVVIQRQMKMMEYMGKQAQKIGLRFDEMGY